MKLVSIKLYGRHFNATIHKALTMWFVDDSFFAYLNRYRSIGRPPSSVFLRRPHSLNIFSEIAGPIEAKFHMKPSQDGETKIALLAQVTSPYMVKTLFFSPEPLSRLH